MRGPIDDSYMVTGTGESNPRTNINSSRLFREQVTFLFSPARPDSGRSSRPHVFDEGAAHSVDPAFSSSERTQFSKEPKMTSGVSTLISPQLLPVPD
jgi:hypothetical protein